MPRELQSFRVNRFLGLGTSGEAVSRPLRPDSDGSIGLYLADARNLHVPSGRLTNEDAGYIEHIADPSSGAGPWQFLGYLNIQQGTSHLFGMIAGACYEQTDLAGSFNAVTVDPPIDASAKWHGHQYRDAFYLVDGVSGPRVFDGSTLYPWFLDAPTAPTFVVDVSAGAWGAATGYTYIAQYKRSSDGHMSPPSAASANTGVLAFNNNGNQVSVPPNTNYGIDKVVFWRTADGGATYRWLAEVDSSVATYLDQTLDANLSLEEVVGLTAYTDFEFTMLAVVGDRIYFAGIIEGGVERPNRVRWTEIGYPWFVDPLNFTDEIDGVVSSLVRTRAGLLAFTADVVHTVKHIGGGVHKVDEESLPGCVNRWASSATPDGIAWINPNSAFVVDLMKGFEDLGDPTGKSSSIESLIRSASSWQVSWVEWVGKDDYIVFGVTLTGGSAYPDSLLVYDRRREGWWRMEYGGGFAVTIPGLPADRTKSRLIIGQEDGSVIEAFSGETAAGAALVPSFEANPIDVNLAEQKRFRFIDLFWDVVEDTTLSLTWFLDKGASSLTEQVNIESATDTLDVDFMLDDSTLAGESRASYRFKVNKVGDFISLIVSGITGLERVVVSAVDILFQESPRRKSQP